MTGKIRIVTSSFATLEATQPPFNIHAPSKEENLDTARQIIASAGGYKPDVIVLPETFLSAGMPAEQIKEVAEPIPGPVFDFLSESARKFNTNIIAGHLTRENGKIHNQALVINRDGKLFGSYKKNYPVESEIVNGVIPGIDVPVFDLDFARIGVAVCFDLNWPEIWKRFAENGIQIAFWISAYEGGFPLKSYAWTYKYPIVSSVWPYHARVIDVNGDILSSTSRWSRIAFHEFNLDREWYHTDLQLNKIAEIQKKYGEAVTVKTLTEEHLFLLENNVPEKTVKDIAKEFGLISYKDYIARCTEYRNSHLK
jgi:beta-ureidopropionase